MRHSKSRFIEDARRVGTGAVSNRTYRRGESVHLFFEFTISLTNRDKMSKGKIYPSEAKTFHDARTGAKIRQVTDHPSIHHHPFFFIPAYDDAMCRLIFISCRTGSPQIFAEERSTGTLIQLTDRPDLSDWSIYPSHDGSAVFFTAGTSAWRLDLERLKNGSWSILP